ncbi:hypothetical protein CONLIGDRAFT_377547 [Coniochaeta ligniaria NRRL 30616]|uniref:Uncharacterized protein n=1 Tax=Coniochaeta ligniaria NRRL 30616 TaxID=1408157 RepID=A0A1J7J574_9PEZI|nr:hypothetical protein CONLIGDRAFT_377547 [Coniochaeta ligniaria NRRL 30616]
MAGADSAFHVFGFTNGSIPLLFSLLWLRGKKRIRSTGTYIYSHMERLMTLNDFGYHDITWLGQTV